MQVVPGLVIEGWGELDLDRQERRQHPPAAVRLSVNQCLNINIMANIRINTIVTKIANISINIDVKIMLMMMVWSTSVSKSASKHPSAAPILELSRVFNTLTNTRYPKPSRDHISSLDFLGWLKASQQIAKSEQQQQFEKERNIESFKQIAKKLSRRKICHKYLVQV